MALTVRTASWWGCTPHSNLHLLACRVPLIVHSLMDVPASDKTTHTEAAHVSNDTRILLLAAVPYVAGVATHVVNALHSHRVNERRWAFHRLGCRGLRS